MLYANVNGEKIQATPGTRGSCPGCENQVLAKCGEINVWHWAHVASSDCFEWEPETDWHRAWKSRWPKECVEVVMEKDGKRRRADIQTLDGLVIEVQHSAISVEEMRAREEFYGNMIWIFDAREAFADGRLELKVKTKYFSGKDYASKYFAKFWGFQWKHARKTLWHSERPCLLDVGEKDGWLFEICSFSEESPHEGWGKAFKIEDYLTFKLWKGLSVLPAERVIQKPAIEQPIPRRPSLPVRLPSSQSSFWKRQPSVRQFNPTKDESDWQCLTCTGPLDLQERTPELWWCAWCRVFYERRQGAFESIGNERTNQQWQEKQER